MMKAILLGLLKGLAVGSIMATSFVVVALWTAREAKQNRCIRQAVLRRADMEGMRYARIMWRDDSYDRCQDKDGCYLVNGVTANGRYVERVIWYKKLS